MYPGPVLLSYIYIHIIPILYLYTLFLAFCCTNMKHYRSARLFPEFLEPPTRSCTRVIALLGLGNALSRVTTYDAYRPFSPPKRALLYNASNPTVVLGGLRQNGRGIFIEMLAILLITETPIY